MDRIERLGVPSPQVKLRLDMPGFNQRMFEDMRESECLVQEGRWAAQWVLQRLLRTPYDTMQRAKAIAKKAAKEFSRDMRSPHSIFGQPNTTLRSAQ